MTTEELKAWAEERRKEQYRGWDDLGAAILRLIAEKEAAEDGMRQFVERAAKERERADAAEAKLAEVEGLAERMGTRAWTAEERVEALEKVVEAARWFSEHVYPPDVWLPEEVPDDYPDHEHGGLDEGSRWAKRLNARLAALAGRKP